MSYTLAIIKPNAMKNYFQILDMIEDAGFEIMELVQKKITVEEAEIFYQEHVTKSFFKELINFMTSEEVIVLVLSKPKAVPDFRTLIGDTDPAKAAMGTIRHIYGNHLDKGQNAIHGSDSEKSAKREISLFFGDNF